MKSIFVIASLVLSVVASADLKKIQGKWKPAMGEMMGSALPKAMLDKMVLVIKGNTYDYDEGHGHDYGNLKEVAGKPMGLDVIGTNGPNKGKTFPTIYKMEGQQLIICYGLDGKRPASFKHEGKAMTMLMTYQRVK